MSLVQYKSNTAWPPKPTAEKPAATQLKFLSFGSIMFAGCTMTFGLKGVLMYSCIRTRTKTRKANFTLIIFGTDPKQHWIQQFLCRFKEMKLKGLTAKRFDYYQRIGKLTKEGDIFEPVPGDGIDFAKIS